MAAANPVPPSLSLPLADNVISYYGLSIPNSNNLIWKAFRQINKHVLDVCPAKQKERFDDKNVGVVFCTFCEDDFIKQLPEAQRCWQLYINKGTSNMTAHLKSIHGNDARTRVIQANGEVKIDKFLERKVSKDQQLQYLLAAFMAEQNLSFKVRTDKLLLLYLYNLLQFISSNYR